MEWIQMKDYIDMMSGRNDILVRIYNTKRRGDFLSYNWGE